MAYDAVEVRPEGLAALLDGLGPEWVGLSLTMPLKQQVLPLLDTVSDLAVATGAANTVVLSAQGRAGDNTDVHGIVAALAEAGVDRVERSVVVGAGATAASALAALERLGDPAPVVLVREPARAAGLLEAAARLGVDPVVERLDPDVLADAQVVVSTVPAGALDALAADLPRCPGVLLDVVYDPWPTALARAWAGPVVGGAAMLLHQAARQVELMTGHPAPLARMRAALAPSLLSSPGTSPPK